MQSQDVTKKDLIIVGGGLSGLTTAYYLKQYDFGPPLILEAKNDIGGRIQTTNEIDLGATWFGNEHEQLKDLLNKIGVQHFPQYQKGKGIFIHSAADPPHLFDTEHQNATTYRIAGGSNTLIKTLAEQSQPEIRLNQQVTKIRRRENDIEVVTDDTIFYTGKVVVSLPPRLINQSIEFRPALPSSLTALMQETQTWMSNAMKVGLAYSKPFWRKQNFSGTLIAPNGPMIELYDHSSQNKSTYALMGFANEALRNHSLKKRKEIIVNFLATHFGSDAEEYLSYNEKDWMKDRFTATDLTKSIYMRPQYGHTLWNKWYMDGCLRFSGSETDETFGGYMEGAVRAGKQAAEMIIQND